MPPEESAPEDPAMEESAPKNRDRERVGKHPVTRWPIHGGAGFAGAPATTATGPEAISFGAGERAPSAAIDGVRLASAGLRHRYRAVADVCLMAFDPGTAVAGVFTRSKTASAPVDWCRRALTGGRARAVAIVVNSGNANAFTGRLGSRRSTAAIAQAAAATLGCRPREVFVWPRPG